MQSFSDPGRPADRAQCGGESPPDPPTVFSIGPVGRLLQFLVGLRVASGPFAGMRYLDRGYYGAYLPRLLGTYEKEIHGPWMRLAQLCGSGTLVNIGAAEGYYAVGALFTRQFRRVVTFERGETYRRLQGELAKRNGVGARLDIRGTCDPSSLRLCLRECTAPVALLVDVEGFEATLLDPCEVPELRACALLVELHEGFQPGVTARIRDCFGPTHSIETFDPAPRTEADVPAAPPFLRWFPAASRRRWVDEGRPIATPWLLMLPRTI